MKKGQKRNSNSQRKHSNSRNTGDAEALHRMRQRMQNMDLKDYEDYEDAVWEEYLRIRIYQIDDNVADCEVHPLLKEMWRGEVVSSDGLTDVDSDMALHESRTSIQAESHSGSIESQLRQLENKPIATGLIPYIREAVRLKKQPWDALCKYREIFGSLFAKIDQNQDCDEEILDLIALSPFWVVDPNDLGLCKDRCELYQRLFSIHLVPKSLIPIRIKPTNYNVKTFRLDKETIWFLQLARGGNLTRLGRVFGWNIPAKLQKQFDRVPEGLEFTDSLIFAEVFRLGGIEVDAQRLISYPSFRIDFTESTYSGQFLKFWRETIAWLITHRDALQAEHLPMILAWAQHCYTESEAGRQPSFSWKRRSPAAALQASEAYDRARHHPRYTQYQSTWSNHGWDWVHIDSDSLTWKFSELTSGSELFEEGMAMSHCVGTYAPRCANGHCAIFSLRRNDVRISTIEVCLVTKRVVQARGRFNEYPSAVTLDTINLWLQSVVSKTECNQ